MFGLIRREAKQSRFGVCQYLCMGMLWTLASGSGAELPTVVISEFMAANDSTLKDGAGEYSDWIELHNFGPDKVELTGCYLTDSRREPTKWVFPKMNLDAGAFLIIFASGASSHVEGNLHANFQLNAKGDYLALVASNGRTVIQEFGKKFPKQRKDVSYGLSREWKPGAPYEAHYQFLEVPTPGAANAAVLLGDVASVKMSHSRGFYSKGFRLELRTKTEGATIRYTFDGSEPSAQHGTICEAAIPIERTTVLRIAAFKPGYRPSKVKSHTFVFPEDVIFQSPDGLPPELFPYLWGKNHVDYGMDPKVVEDPRYQDEIVDGLKSIPTFSVVTDMAHLFDAESGIYSNPGEQGREWERPCSLELIYPNGKKGFQIDCGIRIRGGFSRNPVNAKHAFRFFFRDEYGPSKLKYPLFGKDGADEFDNIDLRTFQNYSWSYQLDPRGVFIRDQVNRDIQLAMGEPGARGEFCHLYLNGHYWGIYNTCERIKASFGETYLGGDKEDYDAIKIDSGWTTRRSTYTVVPTDGNREAWERLYEKASAGLAGNEAYFGLQGMNADGSPSPTKEALMDVDNLISYMLVIFYGGNLDAPISAFGGNRGPNNWHGLYRRGGEEGFQFFIWDAEHTLLNVEEDRTGPFRTGDSVDYSSPQWLWQQCLDNAEFRLRVADHIYKNFFNGGPLTAAAVRDCIKKRAEEIESAVICESARWGDVEHGFRQGQDPRRDENRKLVRAFNREDDWRPEMNRILNEYVPKRSDVALAQLYRQGLYPDVDPPQLSRLGGKVKSGYRLEMKAAVGTIYYTTDGLDPRCVGGRVADWAQLYTEAIEIRRNTKIKARVLLDGDWSALVEANYLVRR
ncbi:MAG: hypothetical protein M2R45_02525 [Verrucomicrobia subdivision 3 bacterium]|nr:hypothetical protein [Limisphaerales bacterium]MCS1414267.1 hypothetical protein [Limisphaerales bacterium]